MADPKFLQYVDDHKDDYINRLSKAVSIPSYVPGQVSSLSCSHQVNSVSGNLR